MQHLPVLWKKSCCHLVSPPPAACLLSTTALITLPVPCCRACPGAVLGAGDHRGISGHPQGTSSAPRGGWAGFWLGCKDQGSEVFALARAAQSRSLAHPCTAASSPSQHERGQAVAVLAGPCCPPGRASGWFSSPMAPTAWYKCLHHQPLRLGDTGMLLCPPAEVGL